MTGIVKLALLVVYTAARILFGGALDFGLTFVVLAIGSAPMLWLAGATDVRGVAITIGCVGGGLFAMAQMARNSLKVGEAIANARTKARLAALEDEP